ncbi:hypothetical protein A3A05_00125 [Candidatus Nomurabacteria bacterium RIFCSPLOWO2_01_FULL_41_12]|uniref:DUF4258 domain-containing protein n=1 Tax=Candidatus Nomurabacteria bacterium RIFCSPLOWO2_01_FULL_41_12 TaxID=1801774 RepID=A0A1F6WXD5_9BACT|nr:MAG: hypothetical protein A2732_01150 [Candidatus Nomurabacteria bacterium RIFCSPHIGHO2_01_FULL_40_10]OGI86520.1 MAG: hypothetical protein A3A05_00125 [Candidatus Nomurabacteria bacterium RIFCSPLOWO2_01_FULL_41_12]
MAEIILTNHVQSRLLERGIDVHEAKQTAKNGKITKKENNGKITKERILYDGRVLVVVFKQEMSKIIIITAYYYEN